MRVSNLRTRTLFCQLEVNDLSTVLRGVRPQGWRRPGKVDAMAELLGADEVGSALETRPGWAGDTARISRTVTFRSFPEAIGAVDRVAILAEEMDHHPDIDIRWRNVTFHCATHSMHGVTQRDLTLADRISEVVDEAGGRDADQAAGAA